MSKDTHLFIIISTAAALLVGWMIVIGAATFYFGMQLGQYHLHPGHPMVRAGAWRPDPAHKGYETRPIVLTNVWFTMASNQRRDPRYPTPSGTIPAEAYGDTKVTWQPPLWGSLAASSMVPVGLAVAGWWSCRRPAPAAAAAARGEGRGATLP